MSRVTEYDVPIAAAKQSGFTLIEISIVLTIIGLIVGGVVLGKSLVRQAQVRSVINEYATYNQAVINFREKYLALPGDFAGAEALWGSDTNCPNTSYTATPHTATCNGQGDGNIDQGYEMFRSWQQLSDAGFIDGTYTGVSGATSGDQHVPGVNVPASAIPGGGWELVYFGTITGDTDPEFYNGAYQNSLAVGAPRLKGSTIVGDDSPIFTPAEAMGIDSKIDDGLPATGFAHSWKSTVNPNCTTADISSSSTQYLLSYSGIACSFKFVQQF